MPTCNDRSSLEVAQALNALRLRAIEARGKMLSLGTSIYMPILDMQASREGITIQHTERVRLRQIMNGNVRTSDADLIALVERAIEAQQALAAQ